MRKLLIFLAVLGVGIAILLWVDRASPSKHALPRDELPDQPDVPQPQRGVLTDIDDPSKGQQATVSGPLDAFTYQRAADGKLLKRSHLVASDFLTVGQGAVELRDFEFDLFDAATGKREVSARAGLARARMSLDVKTKLTLDESSPIQLESTEVTYEVGSRFAPLTVKVPRLEGVVALDSASSEDTVELVGRGLTATGVGLKVERRAEVLTLERDPRADIELEDRSTIQLSSSGALVLRARPDLGEGMAEFDVRDSARLSALGPEGFDVTADSILLRGRIDRGVNDRFRPTYGEAIGHVQLTPAEGMARGDRLVIQFDEAGKPLHAALDGKPELDLVLRGTRLENVPPELLREGETLTVQLDGAGPLEFFYSKPERFVFTGPARMRLPAVGATLECDGVVSGTSDDKGRMESLVADQNVRLHYEKLDLVSRSIAVRSSFDRDGKNVALLDSAGPTTIAGELEDGRNIELVAGGGLSIERSSERFVVTEAKAISLVMGPEKPLRARANSLRLLDVEANTFTAEGDVHVENQTGTGSGERFVANSADSGVFSGVGDNPARFTFKNGSFEAQVVDASSSRLTARGRARAHIDYDEFDYDLGADWMVVQRVLRPNGDAVIVLDAGETSHVEQVGPDWKLTLDARLFHAEALEKPTGTDVLDVEPELAWATGNVVFEISDPTPRITGRGGYLELRGDQSGRLTPEPGSDEKVRLQGRLTERVDTFDVLARRIEFQPESLTAIDYEADFAGIDLELGARTEDDAKRTLRAVGGSATVDKSRITLTEGVYLGGARTPTDRWSLDASKAVLESRSSEGESSSHFVVQDLAAEGDVRIDLGSFGRARAHLMSAAYGTNQLTLIGDPSSVVARDAVLDRNAAVWRAIRFDVDLASGFVRSGAGRVQANVKSLDSWTLSYDALEPMQLADQTVQIFRQPVWRSAEVELRANWAMAWIDPREWRRLSSRRNAAANDDVIDPDERPTTALPKRLFGRFSMGADETWLQELYLDGDVEYRIGEVRKARAEGVYLDLVDGHGWVKDLVLAMTLPIGSRDYELKVHANWIRASADGTMMARGAVATTCSFDVPDYVINIDEFSLRPRFVAVKDEGQGSRVDVLGQPIPAEQKLDGWDLALKGNQLALVGGLGLPLPPIGGPLNADYEFDEEALTLGGVRLPSFGSDSKLGAFISTSFSSDVGAIGRSFHWLIEKAKFAGPNLPDIEGRTRTHVDLHSRGLEVGVDSKFASPGRYEWRTRVDGVLDGGRDRGLVRVDEDDRGPLRGWLHMRGRVLFDEEQWLDAALSRQSDAGVQAEFFERDFVEYEERETYLHWRRARENDYWNATVEARIETYRNEIVDQPSLGWYHGRHEIGNIGAIPIVHAFRTSLEQLARYEGSTLYRTFFGPEFQDGLGDRRVSRADALDTIEFPWSPGVVGLRVTPYLETRATAWSENAADDESASRAAMIVGVQASTTFWRNFDGGSRHMFTPAVRVRGDVAYTDDGGALVQFDRLEQPIDGRFVDFSVRSRWENRELRSDLDVELAQTFADQSQLHEGWLPLATRVTWLSELLGVPYGLTHEARYDTDSGTTDYSRTFAGVELFTDLDVEVGYSTARDTAISPLDPLFAQNYNARLYDALSVGGRYSLSPKWELQGRQTFTVGNSDDRLSSSFTIRRFGHDFVFEIDYSFIAGEGRESLSFNFTPLFAWRRGDTSWLERWREMRR